LRLPEEMKPSLVNLVSWAADGDRNRLREAIVGGALFERPMILYLPSLLPAFCALLARQALGGEPVSPERADELFPTVQEVASAMPIDLDDAMLSKWLRLVTGIDPPPSTAYYKRPEDFDLIGVCAPTAIAGAATLSAHWRPADLGRYYDAVRKLFEHSARLNPSWER
jgi:hypothetical protein